MKGKQYSGNPRLFADFKWVVIGDVLLDLTCFCMFVLHIGFQSLVITEAQSTLNEVQNISFPKRARMVLTLLTLSFRGHNHFSKCFTIACVVFISFRLHMAPLLLSPKNFPLHRQRKCGRGARRRFVGFSHVGANARGSVSRDVLVQKQFMEILLSPILKSCSYDVEVKLVTMAGLSEVTRRLVKSDPRFSIDQPGALEMKPDVEYLEFPTLMELYSF